MALVKLYEVMGEERYLKLSRYFIDERGSKPNYFIDEWEHPGKTSYWVKGTTPTPNLENNQSQLPVLVQSVAVGHLAFGRS